MMKEILNKHFDKFYIRTVSDIIVIEHKIGKLLKKTDWHKLKFLISSGIYSMNT